jgi:hypothetical protein
MDTGKFPASFSNMASVSAFVNVYVFGRFPINEGVNCEGEKKKRRRRRRKSIR